MMSSMSTAVVLVTTEKHGEPVGTALNIITPVDNPLNIMNMGHLFMDVSGTCLRFQLLTSTRPPPRATDPRSWNECHSYMVAGSVNRQATDACVADGGAVQWTGPKQLPLREKTNYSLKAGTVIVFDVPGVKVTVAVQSVVLKVAPAAGRLSPGLRLQDPRPPVASPLGSSAGSRAGSCAGFLKGIRNPMETGGVTRGSPCKGVHWGQNDVRLIETRAEAKVARCRARAERKAAAAMMTAATACVRPGSTNTEYDDTESELTFGGLDTVSEPSVTTRPLGDGPDGVMAVHDCDFGLPVEDCVLNGAGAGAGAGAGSASIIVDPRLFLEGLVCPRERGDGRLLCLGRDPKRAAADPTAVSPVVTATAVTSADQPSKGEPGLAKRGRPRAIRELDTSVCAMFAEERKEAWTRSGRPRTGC